MNSERKKTIRQVHLDFHTSPDISGIGSRFSKENFQQALKAGNVDSITVFAKCHHSLCYYPTEIGTPHPHLDFDLTGAMVEAAHEIGVRAPIYITAGWSEGDAINHPEWRTIKKDGSVFTSPNYEMSAEDDQPRKYCSWQHLCLNDGPYAHHIYDLTEEVCKRYKDVDGLFYDICIVGDACYCENCKQGMKEMGLNPDCEEDAKAYFLLKRKTFMEKCGAILEKYHPGASIFFNAGGANIQKQAFHQYQSHFEMEDLPTSWGGYDKLPLRAKFFVNTGKKTIGMTGKFHLDWGEFGGFKTKDALKFEVASMALYGAGASVGDHMHPDGEMELQTYENIGYAYDYLEKIAPYCYGGESVADVGVCIGKECAANDGIAKILLENQIDFDVIVDGNFEKYKLVILAPGVVLEEKALANLKAYIARGGSLMLMGNALVKEGEFQLDMGIAYLGEAAYDCDYLMPLEVTDKLPKAPLLCNVPGHRVKVLDGEVLAEFITPYFKRTYGQFCGHNNTPYDKSAEHFPAIIQNGNIIYSAHSLASQYFTYGSVFHKYYFMNALKKVYKGFLQVEGLYAEGRCRMIRQPEKKRYCLNMIYASPVRRGVAEIVEDILPVYNIKVQMEAKETIKSVTLPLKGESLPFTQKNGMVSFVVPELCCHTSVVLEY